MFNHVNHPRHTETIADLAETLRPEGLLPVHFDFALVRQGYQTSASLLLHPGIKHQRKAGIMRPSRRAGITHHDIAAGNAHVGVGDSCIGKAHS